MQKQNHGIVLAMGLHRDKNCESKHHDVKANTKHHSASRGQLFDSRLLVQVRRLASSGRPNRVVFTIFVFHLVTEEEPSSEPLHFVKTDRL
jgi:hypothetical protein